MKYSRSLRVCAVGAAAVLAMGLAACGDKKDHKSSSDSAKQSTSMSMQPFGAACSQVPKTGKGSFNGMSSDPVATAASNNPVLSTLVSAVTKADLGGTLNGAQNITVFAPANSAFDKVAPADLQALLADKTKLTSVLKYHVVGQRLTPDQLSKGGSFDTLEGGKITITGSGDNFTVNGNSHVVCGNVQTANATVYIVDTVLMPTA